MDVAGANGDVVGVVRARIGGSLKVRRGVEAQRTTCAQREAGSIGATGDGGRYGIAIGVGRSDLHHRGRILGHGGCSRGGEDRARVVVGDRAVRRHGGGQLAAGEGQLDGLIGLGLVVTEHGHGDGGRSLAGGEDHGARGGHEVVVRGGSATGRDHVVHGDVGGRRLVQRQGEDELLGAGVAFGHLRCVDREGVGDRRITRHVGRDLGIGQGLAGCHRGVGPYTRHHGAGVGDVVSLVRPTPRCAAAGDLGGVVVGDGDLIVQDGTISGLGARDDIEND